MEDSTEKPPQNKNVLHRAIDWLKYRARTNDPKPEKDISNATPLKEYLLESLKSDRLAADPPNKVDLGEFGKEAERLIALSLSNPKHPEYASVGCIDERGRMLILREPVRGDESSVPLPSFKDKRRVFLIHSHGNTDIPFSPSDLDPLLLPPGDSRTAAAVMLITPSLKLLILRTKSTPQFSSLEILDEGVMRWLHPAMQEERRLYEQGYNARGGEEIDLPPLLTEDYKQALRALGHKRMFMLTRAAQEYHLKLYSCPLNKNVALPGN